MLLSTLSYVGTQGSSYPINAIFLWTSGPHEAVMNVGLRPGASISLRDLEEKLRNTLPQQFPGSHFSFDPGDLISQTLNFGTPSVIEVAATGPQYNDVLSYADRVKQELAKIDELRDLGYEEPLHYPSVDVRINRVLAGQLGVTADQIGQAVVSATASSRFVSPNYWRDPASGVSYQVQVEDTAGANDLHQGYRDNTSRERNRSGPARQPSGFGACWERAGGTGPSERTLDDWSFR